MLEQISPLWDVFLQHQKQAKPLVLATVVKTQGSSYKKAGAMMLVENDKTTHGLLSGGCLEADVAEHAMTVFATGQALTISYDLSDDSMFGLGAGCDGSIHIVLQLLHGDYLPFSALNPELQHSKPVDLVINHDEKNGHPIGSFYVKVHGQPTEAHGLASLLQAAPSWLHFRPPPKIAICGAGTDALVVNQLLSFLHWHSLLLDHRAGRLQQLEQTPRTQGITVQLNDLAATISNHHFDAAIIMSHNIDHDASYLAHFAATQTPFLGLLGPVARRDKVLQKARLDAQQLAGRLHAPVGLKVGGRLPENIAVSIVAQLQQHTYQG